MDLTYTVRGGVPLKGDVIVGGSKNAALPLLAASILAEGETVLRNVPDLSDIRATLKILNFLGAETSFENNTVRVNATKIQSKPIPASMCAITGRLPSTHPPG
jgi:UDP-N-acetylglucosamine 1-carboxyvinyltransferase